MPDNAYDAVRYSNYPYAQTHPERLATVAILHGLTPPDPFAARVLEIGCGAGGNLMAMAAATPGIRALGVDLAAEPIAEGQAAIAEIGLGNVELRQGDLRDLADGSLGEFDYIVAHGVYSWIPADAREALMATIRASLAPAGVAYVSFNAHPGGYFRRMLRDVGLWHARAHDDDDPAERAAKAQELYKFLAEHRMTSADTYGALLEREVPALADGPIYRLVHDDLSDHWHPVWFAEFAAHAGRHELAYVGEADLYGLRGEMPARRGRARAVAARRRRPGRVRELHRPADRAPLPPEPALPRRAVDRDRARRGAHASGCTGRSGCTPSRSRSGWSPTSSPSSTRAARARSASSSCGAPGRRARRRWARRCSTASGASA